MVIHGTRWETVVYHTSSHVHSVLSGILRSEVDYDIGCTLSSGSVVNIASFFVTGGRFSHDCELICMGGVSVGEQSELL